MSRGKKLDRHRSLTPVDPASCHKVGQGHELPRRYPIRSIWTAMLSASQAKTSARFAEQLARRLPPPRKFSIRCEADYYGASVEISRAIGRPMPFRSSVGWQHGWVNEPVTDPRQIVGGDRIPRRLLVGTKSHAERLVRQGCQATAVGLPIIYAEAEPVSRVRNTLLVLPAHVTQQSGLSIDQNEYVGYIADQSGDFEAIVACVSAQCVKRGFWTEAFREHRIPWIEGAGIDDAHALSRIKTLLSSVACVTSHAIGSHLAYAACSGCRVSLSGPEHRFLRRDLESEPFYQRNPDLIDVTLDRMSRRQFLEHYPHLGVEPLQAEVCKAWGDQQVGQKHRRSPDQIARLLGWGWSDRVASRTRKIWSQTFRRSAA